MTYATILPNRGVVRLTGKDRATFLQGLITNDVTKITPEQGIYAALLSPQGKFQYDLFIGADANAVEESWLIDCDAGFQQARTEDMVKRLSLYKLRSEVRLENISDRWSVLAVWGSEALSILELSPHPGATKRLEEGVALVDPRLAALGGRLILPQEQIDAFCKTLNLTLTPFEDYDVHRLKLGVPDGSRDVVVDRGILLECGFEELNALDWQKGCYMGQELTARTRYRGLVRKRLIPVHIEGEMPAFQTPVMQNHQEAGEMRTGVKEWGLAMLRLEALSRSAPLLCGYAVLTPRIPGWMLKEET